MAASFAILVHKNLKHELRSWIKTLCEVLIIIIILLIAVVGPIIKDPYPYFVEKDNTKYFNSKLLNNLDTLRAIVENEFGLAFTTKQESFKDTAEEITKAVAAELKLAPVTYCETEKNLEETFDKNKTLAGIVYSLNVNNATNITKLEITLRFPSLFRTIEHGSIEDRLWFTRCSGILSEDENDLNDDVQTDLYVREGFSQLQHLIFMNWYKNLLENRDESSRNESTTQENELREPGNETTTQENELRKPGNESTTQKNELRKPGNESITQEKELRKPGNELQQPGKQILRREIGEKWKNKNESSGNESTTQEKEVYILSLRHGSKYETCDKLVVSDMRISMYYFIFFLPFLNLLWSPWTKHPGSGILNKASPAIFIVFLVTFNMALIVFAMFLVECIQRAKLSVLLGAVLWLSTYGVFSILLDHKIEPNTFSSVVSFLLFFNNTFAYAMFKFEKLPTTEYKSIGVLFGLLLANTAMSLMLLNIAIWLQPGKFMVRTPFNYFGLRKYIIRDTPYRSQPPTESMLKRMAIQGNFEYDHRLPDYVKLKNVITYLGNTKKKKQPFLKNVSLRIHKGAITVILGPRGAGKTTLVRVMAGLKRPDIGSVFYFDENLYENWKKVRFNVDVSWSTSALYDLLTVKETLMYYTRIKLPQFDNVYEKYEVRKWLNVMKDVIDDKNKLVGKLTPQQVRFLALCCTFAADTKIILLDECTMHMQSQEQRAFWATLESEKNNRAIVLMSSSVEEAEIIGDYIAMLDNGAINAYGTPFFLKTKLSTTNDLIIHIKPGSEIEPISEAIWKFYPWVKLHKQNNEYLVYKLPKDKNSQYQKFLIHLENHMEALNISHIEVLGSELTEVYHGMNTSKPEAFADTKKFTAIENTRFTCRQIRALLFKKILQQAPSLAPFIVIVLGLLLVLLVNEFTKILKLPPLRYNGIEMGFSSFQSMRDILDKNVDCSYIHIQNVYKEDTYSMFLNMSRIFTNTSLICGINNTLIESQRNQSIVTNRYGSIEFNDDNSTIWVNQKIFHSAPLALNLFHNIMLYKNFPDLKYYTTIINHPMPVALVQKINILDNVLTHVHLALTVGIVMPIMISAFIVPIIEEKRTHLWILQILAGMNPLAYWIVGLFWDYFSFLIYALIFLVFLLLITLEGFLFIDKFMIFFLFSIYGISALLLNYFLALFFKRSSWEAYLILLIIHISTGLCTFVFFWDALEVNVYFYYIAEMLPSFALLDGISNIYSASKEKQYCEYRCASISGCNNNNQCEKDPECCYDTYFKIEDPGILVPLFYMIGFSVLIIILTVFVGYYQLYLKIRKKYRERPLQSIISPYDDSDVVDMKVSIATAEDLQKRKIFIADNVEYGKVTKSKKPTTMAFAAAKGEAICIYGMPNSGKTNLVMRLIGAKSFKYGDVYAENYAMKRHLQKVRELINYCPQDHGIFRAFTPFELLMMFCMIRGIPLKRSKEIILELADIFGMHMHMNEKLSALPEEYRRKTTVAVCLVAYKNIIILDEPTREMPATTRHQIIDILRLYRDCGKTIIFTTTEGSHCMELADQVVVYNNSNMLAVGTLHHLRSKFSVGFYLELRISRDGTTVEQTEANLLKDIENMNVFVSFLHSDAELVVEHDNYLKYLIPVEKCSYSYLYGALEKNKRRLNISEYTIGQATMLDILSNIESNRSQKLKEASFQNKSK